MINLTAEKIDRCQKIHYERILNDIRTNVQDLKQADDITWSVYQTDKRTRRFVERMKIISKLV